MSCFGCLRLPCGCRKTTHDHGPLCLRAQHAFGHQQGLQGLVCVAHDLGVRDLLLNSFKATDCFGAAVGAYCILCRLKFACFVLRSCSCWFS